jgi:hypothetical protein
MVFLLIFNYVDIFINILIADVSLIYIYLLISIKCVIYPYFTINFGLKVFASSSNKHQLLLRPLPCEGTTTKNIEK